MSELWVECRSTFYPWGHTSAFGRLNPSNNSMFSAEAGGPAAALSAPTQFVLSNFDQEECARTFTRCQSTCQSCLSASVKRLRLCHLWVLGGTPPKDEETEKRERCFFYHSYECLMREGSDSVCSCDQYDAMQLHLQNMHEDKFQNSLPGPVETDRVESSSRSSAHAKFVLSQFTHKNHVEKKGHLHYRCKLCTKEYFHDNYSITKYLGDDYGRLKKHLQKKHWDEAPIPLSVSVKTLHKRKVTRVSRYGGNSDGGDEPVFMTIDLPRNATILSVKQYLIERTSYAHMLDVVLLIGHSDPQPLQPGYRQIASDDSVLSSDTRLLQLQIFDPNEQRFLDYRASKTACTDSAVAADESPSSKWQCAHQYWDHLLAKKLQYPKLHEWNGSSPYFFSKQVVSLVKATRDFIAQSHFFARLQLASYFHSHS